MIKKSGPHHPVNKPHGAMRKFRPQGAEGTGNAGRFRALQFASL
ncbi:hypothetical protein ABIE67_009121 [Streptomyces sp. V4I8]